VLIKLRLREHAYNTVEKGQRLHIQGKILYGEVSVQLKHFCIKLAKSISKIQTT